MDIVITGNDKASKPVKYVPLKEVNEAKKKNEVLIFEDDKEELVKSKVIVIESLTVTAIENIDGNFLFDVHAEFAKLQDGTIINDIDISANEDIDFDDNLTLKKLNSIIRRCGILEKYSKYFTSDPEIIINSYELKVKKSYRFFEEFLDGVQIAQDIFG